MEYTLSITLNIAYCVTVIQLKYGGLNIGINTKKEPNVLENPSCALIVQNNTIVYTRSVVLQSKKYTQCTQKLHRNSKKVNK